MKTISNCKYATPVLGPCKKNRVEMLEKQLEVNSDSLQWVKL